MKFLGLRDGEISYTRTLIRLAVCILLCLIGAFRWSVFPFLADVPVIDYFVVGIAILSLYFGICSVFQLFVIAENRRKPKAVKKEKTQLYELERLLSLVSANDIMDFEILSDEGGILHVGVSADHDPRSGRFFDKVFYIEKQEYSDIEAFRDALSRYATDGFLCLYRIDGMDPKHIK